MLIQLKKEKTKSLNHSKFDVEWKITSVSVKKSTIFFLILEKKIKTLLEGGEVFWHGGKTKLVLDDLKYLAEIEKGQQSSGKCDNVKLFRELYPPQKKSAI